MNGHLRTLTPPAAQRAIVLAPHPDDESLGCGGLVHHLHRSGLDITFVFASDGEAADPSLSPEARQELAATRVAESERAVQQLAPGAEIVRLHLPDSRVAGCEHLLRHELLHLCDETTLVVAPHARDLHPDHEAVGRAALAVARARGCAHLAYGIWMWHWRRPPGAAYGWGRARVFTLGDDELRAKQGAIDAYPSQTTGRAGGSGPVVDDAMLRHHLRGTEVYFEGPA